MTKSLLKINLFLFISLFLSLSVSQAKTTKKWPDKVKVSMTTNHGEILLELDHKKAPITVKNFVKYVEDGFYNGTIFHRVIDGFMIQGGGFTKEMSKKETRNAIKNEAHNGLSNEVGTIAMARTQDVDSATAQFFINVNNNSSLNHMDKSQRGYGYAVFGKVVKGMPVVNKIKLTRTTVNGRHRNFPASPVIIEKATVVK